MHEWPGQDPTAVRATDLAAAASVVVRFRRRRRATLAAATCVGVATLVSSRAFFAVSTTSLVPTDPPPTTAPPGALLVTPEPSPAPSPLPSQAVEGGPRPVGAGVPGGGPAAVTPAGPVAHAPGPQRPARAPFRIGMKRETIGSGMGQCGLNALPNQPHLCFGSGAAQQKSGAVILTYTACQSQPSLAAVDLRFKTAHEVDFLIAKDGRIVWTWSKGQRFAATGHTVRIGRDQCTTWRTRWTGKLDDGTRVPPGTYRLRAVGLDETAKLALRRTNFEIKF